jgi:hypothetical protein
LTIQPAAQSVVSREKIAAVPLAGDETSVFVAMLSSR